MNKEQQIEKDRLIQIEEIDELIREKVHGQVAYRMDISKYGGFNGYTPLCTYDISKALYNAGYRKTLPNTELFTQNMKNVLEIEKKQAVKEFAEKLKEYINEYEEIESKATYKDITTYRCKFAKNTETKDATWARHKGFLSGLLTAVSKIDELLKESGK